MDAYATLGIAPGATLEQARAAYLALARRYHPDSKAEGATPNAERFIAAKRAYDWVCKYGSQAGSGSQGGRFEPEEAEEEEYEPEMEWRHRENTTRPGHGFTGGYYPPGQTSIVGLFRNFFWVIGDWSRPSFLFFAMIVFWVLSIVYREQSRTDSYIRYRESLETRSSFYMKPEHYYPMLGNRVTEEMHRADALKGAPIQVDPMPIDLNKLQQEGYTLQDLPTGPMHICYGYSNLCDSSRTLGATTNSLLFKGASGQPAVLRVIEVESGECLRYIYLNPGTVWLVDSLPAGRYKVQFKEGRQWMSRTTDGHCLGRFANAQVHKQAREVYDFPPPTTRSGPFATALKYMVNLETVAADTLAEDEL